MQYEIHEIADATHRPALPPPVCLNVSVRSCAYPAPPRTGGGFPENEVRS